MSKNQRSGRNAPCPCGSGFKFKKCCMGTLFHGDSDPPRIFAKPLSLPAIESFGDLQAYWDAYFAKFLIWRWTRNQAVVSILRSISFLDEFGMTPRLLEGSDYLGDDALHYLMMHVFKKCEPGSPTVPDPTLQELDIVHSTFQHVKILARIRDHIEQVRLGYARCEIDQERRIVRFFELPHTSQNLARREQAASQEHQSRQWSLDSLMEEEPLKSAAEEVSRLAFPTQLASSVEPDARFVEAAHRLRMLLPGREHSRRLAPPESLELGPYNVESYKGVSEYLASIGWASELWHAFRIQQHGQFPTLDVPFVEFDREDLTLSLAEKGIDRSHIPAVLRDLEFNSEQAWMPVSDYPLIPVGTNRFVSIPRLLRDHEWAGALLRSLDRLPWRRQAREIFNQHRESIMQEAIENLFRERDLVGRKNILLGPRSAPVGDIDLVCWKPGEQDALALSLKWYYPPRFIQEVVSQENRVRKEVETHKELCGRWPEFSRDVSSNYSVPGFSNVLPVVVVEPGPIYEKARNQGISVVAFDSLTDILGKGNWTSVRDLYGILQAETREPLRFQMRYSYREFPLAGPWRFIVPVPGIDRRPDSQRGGEEK